MYAAVHIYLISRIRLCGLREWFRIPVTGVDNVHCLQIAVHCTEGITSITIPAWCGNDGDG